jgi:predicted transcriptional regulator
MKDKEKALQWITAMSDDATAEDIIYRLTFMFKVEAGIRELDAGLGIPHEEVKRRLARWLGPQHSR